MSLTASVEVVVGKLLEVFCQSIHPDKLAGFYEKHNTAAECEVLMAQLEKLADEFTRQAELQTHGPSAFSELELDVQTLPLLNVSSQIVKVALMGALTFFGDQVQLYLCVALVGNLLLLVLVIRNPLACSAWSRSTLVPASEKNAIPLYTMHVGWLLLTLVLAVAVRRQRRKLQSTIIFKTVGGWRVSILTRQPSAERASAMNANKRPQLVLPDPSQL
ncbi:hypothetical protein Gpo141_00005772 [Globisporangium polare]